LGRRLVWPLLKNQTESTVCIKKGEEGKIGPALAPRFLPEHPIPLLLLIVRESHPQNNFADAAGLKEY